jgi:hypothetical protein
MRALACFFLRLWAVAALAVAAGPVMAGGESPMRDLAFASNLQTLAEMPLYEPPQLQLQRPDPAMQMLMFLNRVADMADRADRAERGLTTPDNVAIAEASIAMRAAHDASRMLRLSLPPLPPLSADTAGAQADRLEVGHAGELQLDPGAWRSTAAAGGGGAGGLDDGLAPRVSATRVANSVPSSNNAPQQVYDPQAAHALADLSHSLAQMGVLPILLSFAALVLLGWIGWRAAA